jgi:hypothetical protein
LHTSIIGKAPAAAALPQLRSRDQLGLDALIKYVELYIDRGAGQTEENKRIFDRLHGQKKAIEGAFGGELSWQRLDGKQGCRIASIVAVGGYRSAESKWPGIQDAMIDAMNRLEKALLPHLDKLKAELASYGP